VNAFREAHNELAYSPDPRLASAGYEYIPADVHVPVLDVQNLPALPSDRVLSNAVIQGFFDTDRRDYDRIFNELIQNLYGKWISSTHTSLLQHLATFSQRIPNYGATSHSTADLHSHMIPVSQIHLSVFISLARATSSSLRN
jgi:hypothetical protein